MSINQQKLRDLDLRTQVSPSMIGLLRRANGLELLTGRDSATEYSDHRPAGHKTVLGETFLGWDFVDGKLVKLVMVVEDVHYPAPGWASDERKDWDAELTCLSECIFPMACPCHEAHANILFR